MLLIHCADLHPDSGLTSNFNKDMAGERTAAIRHGLRAISGEEVPGCG